MIELDDFRNLEISQQICGNFGEGINKSITAFFDIWVMENYFVVYKDKQEVFRSESLACAVDFYNKLEEEQ